eukprot:TRINITY_DN895_c0_g1_i1.p1 TRINITY_DN895_c0_g1~~TRINITY_DN895_c0_g1_i1.p1  ORF type:complete len:309 (-),score=106.66 TRINITY_DN895_c0_g1_i1:42-968(-)
MVVGVWKDLAIVLGLGLIRVLFDALAFVLSPFLFLWGRLVAGNRKTFKSILITGGNSGLGEALALSFAGPGVRLVLTARNSEKLQSVKEKCEKKGSEVRTESVDVTNKNAMQAIIEKADDEKPLDLVIANAGVSSETLGLRNLDESAAPLVDININGVLNTVFPIVQRFRKRRNGQLAIMSSAAGLAPLLSSPIYSATKAFVRYFGEGLRPMLAVDRVGVTVICPGFVRSPMTDAVAKKKVTLPFLVESDEAAAIMKDGLERNVPVIAYPFPVTLLQTSLSSFVFEVRERVLALMAPKRGAKIFFNDI